jgi:hypothetical protein
MIGFCRLLALLVSCYVGMHGLLGQPAPEGAAAWPRYTYRDGKVQGQLPYGRDFALRGSTLQPGSNERADVVELVIYEEVNRRRRIRQERRWLFKPDSLQVSFGGKALYRGFWWYTEDKDPQQFEIYVGKGLQLNTYYRLVLNFYQRYQIGDETTRRLVESVKARIYQQGNQSVRVAEVEAALNEAVADYARGVKFGYLALGRQNQVRFDTSAKRLRLPVSEDFPLNLQLEIGRVIQQEQILADANAKLEAQLLEVQQFGRSDTFNNLVMRLQNLLLTDTGEVAYRANDVRALSNFVQKGQVSVDPFPSLLRYAESPAGRKALSDLQQQVLLALRANYFIPIRRLTRQRDRLIDQIQLRNERIGNGGLDRLIAEGFIQAQSAEVIETPFASAPEQEAADGSNRRQTYSLDPNDNYVPSTGYNAINIGTAYGVGLVGLNFPDLFPPEPQPFARTELNLITYLGAKFYFSQIDKARFVADPYPLFRDRLSMLLGVRVTGELNYRGRNFQNVIGVQPVAGLSLDLNRALCLDLGFIFFSEASLTPFNDIQRLRTAPFVGLSLDANAFNAVRNLLDATNYR